MQTLFQILTSENNVAMQYEIAGMLCAFFVSAARIRDRKKLGLIWTGIFLFFIYIHRILLPFLVSGLYCGLIAGLVCLIIKADPKAFLLPAGVLRQKAKLYLARPILPCTAVILTILLIQLCRINLTIDYDSIRYGLRSDVLLTDGLGIAGFFSNTGLVNSVYMYPKGFELLTRPLYFGGTYGYVLCCNIWILIGIILLAGAIAGRASHSPEAEVFAAMMTALIPGVTNMAVTAKSDLATLLCQLGFVYCVSAAAVLRASGDKAGQMTAGQHDRPLFEHLEARLFSFLPSEKSRAGSAAGRLCCPAESETGLLTGAGIGALILSFAFKPTAVVFSSVLGLAAAAFYLSTKRRLHLNAAGVRSLMLSLLFTGIVTLRTFLITGQPLAGVFSSAQEKLGFTLKYPFRVQSFLYEEEALSAADKIRGYLTRLAGFLICPAGEDMSHVLMAWGGLVFLIMLLLILFFSRETGEKMEDLDRLFRVDADGCAFCAGAFRYQLFSFAAIGAVSLVSLYLLYQVDGNYFMLWYTLAAIAGTGVLFARVQFELSGLGRNFRKLFSGGNSAALVLLSALMIYFTAFTGWCGPCGFTPVDFVNRGFYSHRAEYNLESGVWDDYARVLAMAGEPDCYRMNGRIESWVDIDGSGGNVYLTDTKFNIFKEYLAFADIDYIYADLYFLNDPENSRRQRAAELFVWLLEDGSFEEIGLLPGTETKIAAKLDKERVSVDWETPMAPGLTERIEEQKNWFHGISPQ